MAGEAISVVELVGAMIGSGALTGGLTLAGLKVEIRYLREADKRQQAENEQMRLRVDTLEKDQIKVHGMALRAHERIDQIAGAR
ncbi:hypothetical protein [Marinobacter sp. bablab_jr008]|jgi:hypothetical protein|uniref:hypothetical protein n=1 Tax=Marinobacter sp. bablab_jr008 TaxID=2755064 RepID=UPI0018F26BA7|nr:hypothetical protein [Marinobacter sp. bablab_jr008]